MKDALIKTDFGMVMLGFDLTKHGVIPAYNLEWADAHKPIKVFLCVNGAEPSIESLIGVAEKVGQGEGVVFDFTLYDCEATKKLGWLLSHGVQPRIVSAIADTVTREFYFNIVV